MMSRFSVRLEACDPYQGRFRAYRIDAGLDLLGDWLVDVTYGRIRHVAADEAEARRIVRRCLQRRRTAPKRIGVPYQLRELADPRPMAGRLALRNALPPALSCHECMVRRPPARKISVSFTVARRWLRQPILSKVLHAICLNVLAT